MDPVIAQIIVAAIGVIGAVVGAIVGARTAIRVEIAVLMQKMQWAEAEIKGLREVRHLVADRITALQWEIMKLKGHP